METSADFDFDLFYFLNVLEGHVCSYAVSMCMCVSDEEWGSNICWWQLASLSSIAGTDTSGSVVFIFGETDTQWVAPSLALVRSLSNKPWPDSQPLGPPAVVYN